MFIIFVIFYFKQKHIFIIQYININLNIMRYKMDDNDKKTKITININEKLNEILLELMKNGKNKSQIVEEALKLYNNTLSEKITENDIFMMLDKLKNK
jgi:hypothetical protein